MPGGYVINRTRSIVLSRRWCVLKDSELLAHSRALAAGPCFAPHLNQLFDFRDLDSALQWLGIAGEKQAILSALSEVPGMFVDESDASSGTGGKPC
jgi:hypothetical protein